MRAWFKAGRRSVPMLGRLTADPSKSRHEPVKVRRIYQQTHVSGPFTYHRRSRISSSLRRSRNDPPPQDLLQFIHPDNGFATAHHLRVPLGAYTDKNWRLNPALASKMTHENGLL
jgi:hypothetical protein